MTMKPMFRFTLAVAFVATLSFAPLDAQITAGRPEVGGLYDEEKHDIDIAQSNWRLGMGVGPSISLNADLIADFRAQERLYVRRQFSDLFQAEIGLGIHRIAGNYLTPEEYDTHFWSLDGRALIAPRLNDQWNPYAFAGVGYSLFRIIDRAEGEHVMSEGRTINTVNEGLPDRGWAPVVPLGIGVQFKPERHARIALDMNLGYTMMFTNEHDGVAGGDDASHINGMISLQYLFHDAVPMR